jgi:AraC-like DNA-binding protein
MDKVAATSTEAHSTLVSVAATLVSALESYGVGYRPVLAEAGLDPDAVYNPSERITTVQFKKLWDIALRESGDPCFGLTCGAYIQPSSLHGLGLSWIASHTLKEGLERVIRFQKILSTESMLALRETDDGYCIYDTISQKDDPFGFPAAVYDSFVAIVFRICTIMMGPDIRPARVSLEHVAPACTERFTEFFGIPVEFSAKENAIEFSRNIAEQASASANPELTRINDQVVIDYLNQFDKDDIVTKTRTYIIDHLPSGVPKQADIAADLNMSLRSLQRRLSQSGTSYSGVLQQVRQDMARHYLQTPGYQVLQVAYVLGFSDPGNFSRAFKRWTGLNPHQYRQQQLEQ